MKKWLLLVGLMAVGIAGCGSVENIIDEVKDAANGYVAKYAGTYAGTFKSTAGTNDAGTFNFLVDNEGKAKGTITSTVLNSTSSLTGTVDPAGFVSTTAGDYSFSGNVASSGGYSGTWKSSKSTGTLTGSRKEGAISDSSTSTTTTSTNGGYTCAKAAMATNSKCPTIEYCLNSAATSGYYSAGGKTWSLDPSNPTSINSAATAVAQYCVN